MIVEREVHCDFACSSSHSTRSNGTPAAAMVVVSSISVLLMEMTFTDFHRLLQQDLLQIPTDYNLKSFTNFKKCYIECMKEPKKRVLGIDSTQVGFSIEKDLVSRIDVLAKRDCISRSTWMREALIQAWREGKEFKRTPLHGYLSTPIPIPTELSEKGHEENPKQNKKA